MGITLVDVHLNWLKWFHFLILQGGLLVILIDCMIFLSLLDFIRMFMSTISFLILLGSRLWTPPHFGFPLITQETVKAITLAFRSIQIYFIRNIRVKFDIRKSPQSPDIGQNSDGISDSQISGQSLIKENVHNSRTSNDIDIKLGQVTKLDKRNKTTSKKLTMTSCQQVVTSLSFFRYMASLKQSGTWIPDA